jgi:hypothetical protein
MGCYACEQVATKRCSRCGRGYCQEHGGELCAECLAPVSATPSNIVFRSSLFALLVASVLALWLLVRPPDLPGEESSVAPQQTALDATQAAGESPAAESPTTAPEATPSPAPETPPPAAPAQYTVVEGDTWFGIAGTLGVDAEALAAANGRTLEDFIQPGEVLVVPQ